MTTVFSGSTGFVGKEILNQILENSTEEDKIICILNKNFSINKNKKIIYRYGDCNIEDTWSRLFEEFKIDKIIISSNIRHVKPLFNVIRKIKYKPRIIIVGTTGVHSKFLKCSSIYIKLENLISKYSGSFLVLRSTMIYGGGKDKNMNNVIKFINNYKFFFGFGSGNNLFRPIFYKDLAKAVFNGYKNEEIEGFIDVAGETIISYKNILKTIFLELNLKPRIIILPLNLIMIILKFIELCKIKLPIKSEQIMRLKEDKSFEIDTARKSLDFKPVSFSKGIKLQIKSMYDDKLLT